MLSQVEKGGRGGEWGDDYTILLPVALACDVWLFVGCLRFGVFVYLCFVFGSCCRWGVVLLLFSSENSVYFS